MKPPRPADIHAWVLIDDRDAQVLAPHWHQVIPTPATWRGQFEGRSPDLLLLAAHPSGWLNDEVVELVSEAIARAIPVLAWTSAPESLPAELAGPPVTVIRRDRESDADHSVVGLAVEAWPTPPVLPNPAHRRHAAVLTRERESWRGLLPSRSSGMAVTVSAEAGEDLSELASQRALLAPSDGDARAVLRAGLVGTPVLARNDTPGALPTDIAALVHEVDDRSVRAEVLALLTQDEYFDRDAHVMRRRVLRNHTGSAQVAALAAAAGLPPQARGVSAVVPTNRVHELRNVLANVGRQTYADVELVLVAHGIDLDEADVQAEAADFGVHNMVVVRAEPTSTLGACMNLGLDAASGHYVAKMDDDNLYGAEFLGDLVDSAQQTGASIVGKWAHYVWLRRSGAVVLRNPAAEHTFERRVQGGAMLFDGAFVRSLRFSDIPRAVDSDILDRALQQDASIYSADRFNFVSVRGTSTAGHTWKVDDLTFLTAAGRLQFYGDPTEHVTV